MQSYMLNYYYYLHIRDNIVVLCTMIQVKVFYTAKLKSSGHVFDSNIDKAPYKFRLGTTRPDSISLSKMDRLD